MPPPPSTPQTTEQSGENTAPEDSNSRHPLLIPTLHQIASSRTIKLVFLPTLSHLRAYLGVFHPGLQVSSSHQAYDKPGRQSSKLIVYGLIALHKDTSEWSAQGLGQTLASLVEAGKRTQSNVVIVEQKRAEDGVEHYVDQEEEVAEFDPLQKTNKEMLQDWEEEVPILSGGKRSGLEGGWSGRMVEVGRVVGRWFTFEKGEWNI